MQKLDYKISNNTLTKSLLQSCRDTKKTRENLVNDFIYQYAELSLLIINENNLQRLADKYIRDFRKYDENSYSRSKIKNEELSFIEQMIIYSSLEDTLKGYFEDVNFLLNDTSIKEPIISKVFRLSSTNIEE